MLEVIKHASDADLILLGPQIRHEKQRIESKLGCPVMIIDMQDYGMMNGASVIDKAMKILSK